jgi:hypothetical protein
MKAMWQPIKAPARNRLYSVRSMQTYICLDFCGPKKSRPDKAREVVVSGDAVDCVWNVMAQAQKPDFVFRRNGRVHLNRRGRQFIPLLAA